MDVFCLCIVVYRGWVGMDGAERLGCQVWAPFPLVSNKPATQSQPQWEGLSRLDVVTGVECSRTVQPRRVLDWGGWEF